MGALHEKAGKEAGGGYAIAASHATAIGVWKKPLANDYRLLA